MHTGNNRIYSLFSQKTLEYSDFISWTISIKTSPNKCENSTFSTFFDAFCDFFKSYGSNPLTLIMFFVVLWEVLSPLRAIFDIMTQNREKLIAKNESYLSPFEAFLKVKYSKNQGDDF